MGRGKGRKAIVGTDTEARRQWLAERHGDLSLVALASALYSSALLAAALLAGFLT